MELLKQLQEAGVFKPPSKEEAEKRKASRKSLSNMPSHMDQNDPVDRFRWQYAGNSLGEPELTGEAKKIADKYWEDRNTVHAIHPDAGYLYCERKVDPKQYRELIDVKGDFIEEIAVAAVPKKEMRAAMTSITLKQLDALEKHGATSELLRIPTGSKWFVLSLGLEAVFCKTVPEIKKAMGDE